MILLFQTMCRIILLLLTVYCFFLCIVANNDSNKESVPPDVYRLPKSVYPDYYKLKVLTHLNDADGFKFYGNVWIKVS